MKLSVRNKVKYYISQWQDDRAVRVALQKMPLFEVLALRILIRHDDFQRHMPTRIFSCVLSAKVVVMDALKSEPNVCKTLGLFLSPYLLWGKQFLFMYIILYFDKVVT